jgi:hypothetical protein
LLRINHTTLRRKEREGEQTVWISEQYLDTLQKSGRDSELNATSAANGSGPKDDEYKQLVGVYDSMTHSFPNRPYSSSSATVDNNPIKLLKHVNASRVETTSHHHPPMPPTLPWTPSLSSTHLELPLTKNSVLDEMQSN